MKKQFIIMMAGILMLVGSVQVTAVTQYTITNLGTLGGGSWACAINNNGQVVGTSHLTVNYYPLHAFLYNGTTMKDLGKIGRSTRLNSSHT